MRFAQSSSLIALTISMVILQGCSGSQSSSGTTPMSVSISRAGPAWETVVVTNNGSNNLISVAETLSSNLSTVNINSAGTSCNTISIANPLEPGNGCSWEILNTTADDPQNISGTMTIRASTANTSYSENYNVNAITYLYGIATHSDTTIARFDGNSWNTQLKVPSNLAGSLAAISVDASPLKTLFVAEADSAPFYVSNWNGTALNNASWSTTTSSSNTIPYLALASPYLGNFYGTSDSIHANIDQWAAGTLQGTLYPTGTGIVWSSPTDAVGALAAVDNNNFTLYAASLLGNKLAMLVDTVWTEVSLPAGAQELNTIAISPNGNNLYINGKDGSNNPLTSESSNEGNSWTTIQTSQIYGALAATNTSLFAAYNGGSTTIDKFVGITKTSLPAAPFAINAIAIGPYINISSAN